MKLRRKVMVFGTFDILHKGHISLFKQAKKFGNHLTVVVARDSNVRKNKNHTPLFNEKKRVKAIKKLKLVDSVILGGEGDPLKIIEKQKPKVILLGYDQEFSAKGLKNALAKRKIIVDVFRAKSHKPKIFKSSKLRKLL